MNDQHPTQTIVVPKWKGPGDYLFVMDENGSIVRVQYENDQFLRIGPRD